MEIEDLYQRYGPMVMRRCRQMLGDEDRAMDATQDVFVKVLRLQHRLDLSSPSSLLYRIATNLCLDQLRRRRRFPETSDDTVLSRIVDADDPEERAGLRSILSKLFTGQKESTRTIAVLHYVDGMTLEETASEVGMSVSGVRKRLRGLRAALRGIEAQ